MERKKNSNTPLECSPLDSVNGKESDPGAARLGNFINYYQFHAPSERLSLLFPDKLYSRLDLCNSDDSLVCLDVGCNSGVSTSFQYNPNNYP